MEIFYPNGTSLRFKAENWCPIQDEKIYKVAISSFLAKGGDEWGFPHYIKFSKIGPHCAEILQNYINKTSPIHQRIEGRIKFVYDLEPEKVNTMFIVVCINFLMVLVFIVALRFCYGSSDPSLRHRLEVPYQNF